MEHDNQLITVEELADCLGVPVATLYQRRYRKEGTSSGSDIVLKGSKRRIRAWKL
ncbi:MAG TPA: hypothetical protein VMS99_00370 [Acidimicrobiia bacterium]|nr:hypothetical protein [Acidimicrobiia bacterium]